jgi:hypothetical protein
MLKHRPTMRREFAALAFAALLASLAVASCSEGGNGIGTAPNQAPPCPAEPPVAGTSCTALQVCSYPTCASPSCPPTELVAVCPFAGGSWELDQRGDGGTFADVDLPEVPTDALDDADETDVEDADDALDADADLDAMDDVADTEIADTELADTEILDTEVVDTADDSEDARGRPD